MLAAGVVWGGVCCGGGGGSACTAVVAGVQQRDGAEFRCGFYSQVQVLLVSRELVQARDLTSRACATATSPRWRVGGVGLRGNGESVFGLTA
jgi:hypothetical protein